MVDELLDRFGEPPKSVMNLLAIAILKAKAHRAYITEIASRGDGLRVTMYPKAQIDPAGIPAMVAGKGRKLRFVPGPKPYFEYETSGDLIEKASELVDEIMMLCTERMMTEE